MQNQVGLRSITMNKASGGDGIPVELLQILKDDVVKVMHSVQFSSVAQPCPTLCDPMDYSLPGSSFHGIFQARILDWVAISFSRSSRPRDWIRVSRIVGRRFTVGATREEYTEELYKRDLHDPDNHDGVITHLEPDILECEVKGALGSRTTNKPTGGDTIPIELFQILKDDAVKVLHSICQQI